MRDLLILGIDTSGKTASVSVFDGEKVLFEKSVYTKLTHSQVILPMVKEALEQCELDFENLDCVAVSGGPGSYTGLRIGIGAVKGMCLGNENLKSAGISTLMGLAYNCVSYRGKIISVMRARPGVVYVGEYVSDGEKIEQISKDIVTDEKEFFGNIQGRFLLAGEYCRTIKNTYFSDNDDVSCASATQCLQRAESLCLAAYQHQELIKAADELEVYYLQQTKAQKQLTIDS